jgi:hypothetical protein
VKHTATKPGFNGTIGLRDSWAKLEKKGDPLAAPEKLLGSPP